MVLLALMASAVYQFLALSMLVSEKAGSDFRCMVAANSVMEAGMASSTPLLNGLISLIGATAVDQWQPLPADFVPAGVAGGFRARISRLLTAEFEGVATTTAAVTVEEALFQGSAMVQGYREPLE